MKWMEQKHVGWQRASDHERVIIKTSQTKQKKHKLTFNKWKETLNEWRNEN